MSQKELFEIKDREAIRDGFREFGEQGQFRHAIPTEQGGCGNDFTALCRVHEALGYRTRSSGFVLSINAHLWGAVFPLLRYGSDRQQQSWIPSLLAGFGIGGHAISEPQAGSDIQAMECEAVPQADGFRLSGHKRFITNVPIADLMVVYSRLEGELSAFLVCRDDSGADFRDGPAVVGSVGLAMGDLVLNDCRIPADRQLGKTGAGAVMIQQALELERAFLFAGIAGVMQWQLETVTDQSRTRMVGGKPLGHHQAVSHRIAEMKMRLDTIRLWVRRCAAMKDAGKRITLESAETKLYAAEAFLASTLDAAQIMGAAGLVAGEPLAGQAHDAIAGRLFSGSSEIQKNIIAALLGTGDGYQASVRR
jgi:L-prolyl-PCP dehydrogenase